MGHRALPKGLSLARLLWNAFSVKKANRNLPLGQLACTLPMLRREERAFFSPIVPKPCAMVQSHSRLSGEFRAKSSRGKLAVWHFHPSWTFENAHYK
jgi:hypothetical protein